MRLNGSGKLLRKIPAEEGVRNRCDGGGRVSFTFDMLLAWVWEGVFCICYTGCRVLICKWKRVERAS